MSATIYGIEHISNCKIQAALQESSEKINGKNTINGKKLFKYCLTHGGFHKPEPNKEQDQLCIWHGESFNPWSVTYENMTYAAYLLCEDIEKDEKWEKIPYALVLLDKSALDN